MNLKDIESISVLLGLSKADFVFIRSENGVWNIPMAHMVELIRLAKLGLALSPTDIDSAEEIK